MSREDIFSYIESMLLQPNMNWAPNQGIALPTVMASVAISDKFIQVDFSVEEPAACFRSEVTADNDHSWEDSCVEIFLQNPANPSEYYNFETTSRGFVLAAHGPDRHKRTLLGPSELQSIQRTKQLASVIGDFISWGMSIHIPASIFGLDTFAGKAIRGNLYKCADKAETPHYLSAFPIETEKPDFHRPEFFQEL